MDCRQGTILTGSDDQGFIQSITRLNRSQYPKPDTEDNSLSISKTAAETGTANQYEITFSMPNQNTSLKKTVDVVFVMDKSSVSYNNNALKDAAISLISQMRASVDADPNVTINVGVLSFHESVFASTQGLLDIRDDNNLKTCEDSLANQFKQRERR